MTQYSEDNVLFHSSPNNGKDGYVAGRFSTALGVCAPSRLLKPMRSFQRTPYKSLYKILRTFLISHLPFHRKKCFKQDKDSPCAQVLRFAWNVTIFLLVGLPRANISRRQSVDENCWRKRWNAENGVLQLSTIYLGVWMTSLWAISKTTSLTCFALGTVSQLKRSRRSNHSFSCSLSSFPFRERLTSSLSSLLRYARKDSNERYSFTTSSPKRKAVVKALPYLIGIKPTCWYPSTVILAMASHSATCKSCLMTGTLSSLPLVHKS